MDRNYPPMPLADASEHPVCEQGAMMDAAGAEATVREYWRLMGSNDFASVAKVLSNHFELRWPQTNERIRGAENFVRMNREYPAHGPWTFDLQRLVAGAQTDSRHEVVTQVLVSDGVQSALAISFFEVSREKIERLTEYWPERYEPPANRAHLTEPLDPCPTNDRHKRQT